MLHSARAPPCPTLLGDPPAFPAILSSPSRESPKLGPRDVAPLVAEGITDQEIAAKLGVKPNTIVNIRRQYRIQRPGWAKRGA
jgi:hypothetical protein